MEYLTSNSKIPLKEHVCNSAIVQPRWGLFFNKMQSYQDFCLLLRNLCLSIKEIYGRLFQLDLFY